MLEKGKKSGQREEKEGGEKSEEGVEGNIKDGNGDDGDSNNLSGGDSKDGNNDIKRDDDRNNINKTSPDYLLNDDGMINQFVYTMYVLLESGCRVSYDRIKSIPLKRHVHLTSVHNDEAQRKQNGGETRLKFLLRDKAKQQQGVGAKIEEIKRLLRQARATRERLRVVKLMNTFSHSGHTALSWAASNGEMRASTAITSHRDHRCNHHHSVNIMILMQIILFFF